MTLQFHFRYFSIFGRYLSEDFPLLALFSVKLAYSRSLGAKIRPVTYLFMFLFETEHSVVAIKKIRKNSWSIFCSTKYFVSEKLLFQAFSNHFPI